MPALAAPPIPRAGRKGLTDEPQDVAFVTVPASSARTRCESSPRDSVPRLNPMPVITPVEDRVLGASVPDVTAVSGVWFAAQTKWAKEKPLAMELALLGVPFFLPLVHRLWYKKGDRTPIHAWVPLFKQYVFFAGGNEAKWAVQDTRLTDRIMQDPQQPRCVRELRAVQLAVGVNPRLGLYMESPVGKKCRVIAGAMMGLEGVCIRINESQAKCKVVLFVTMIGAAVDVETEMENVEILSD